MDRGRAYCRILFIMSVLCGVGLIIFSHRGIDPFGRPLGTDFNSFWTASELALRNRPADAYNPATHHAAEIALFGKAATNYTAFLYPPIFLLICLPLAIIPYFPALLAWLGLTGFTYWRCLRSILPQSGMAVPILAYPGVLLNIGNGQNGFLTATLFGGAMLALRASPILAGMCFGCLIYKPHLGVIIPLALIVSRRWTTFFAAAGTALVLRGASCAVFGLDTWRAFFAAASLARTALERNLIGPYKMPSVFAAVRLIHGSVTTAYALQVIVALIIATAMALALRRGSDAEGEGALIASAALLATPFLLDYDLTVMALPLAWVLREAMRSGFLPFEKLTMAAAYLFPLFCRGIGASLGLPLGPPVLLAVFVIVLPRVRQPSANHNDRHRDAIDERPEAIDRDGLVGPRN